MKRKIERERKTLSRFENLFSMAAYLDDTEGVLVQKFLVP